jgi:hypothetical protein
MAGWTDRTGLPVWQPAPRCWKFLILYNRNFLKLMKNNTNELSTEFAHTNPYQIRKIRDAIGSA